MPCERTTVHLVRHGEVSNPSGILYGRLADFHLSELGREMAGRVASWMADRGLVGLRSSPMERAQETAAPIAAQSGLTVDIDDRLIEAANVFEGKRISFRDGVLSNPAYWRHFGNPFRPSWGEPYRDVAARMRAAVLDARDWARGHEVALVSHQLPIWVARLSVEGRRLWHDPRRRECSLASVTSIIFDGAHVAAISYTEPAEDLVVRSNKMTGA